MADGVTLEGLPGAPPSVGVRDLSIRRGFTDAGSIRLGGELRVQIGRIPLDLRAGVARDASAVPRPLVSLLSLDADRILVSGGVGVHVTSTLRLDAFYGHQFVSDVTVSPEEARVTRIHPLGGDPSAEAINGGTYTSSVNLASIGATYRFR
jgi:long-subunit fatty acid transport protein